ncbi:MAG TPA: pitrilysin family protein, partial [Allosphingosinicella sp.]
MPARLCLVAAAAAASPPARAELDLRRAEVSRLENGLTVIVLEDHSLPVVSTQMIYRSGSRDETAGKTGLAHFLEHLAFRATASFPNGAATDAVYDAGGEWHGYTWLDQTSYYSTMPAGGLDLMLRIEADRMARVTIDPAAIAAERGAVITEMHSYENDPASVLFDAVAAAAFQAHPYRNNTVGYESDVAALTAEDARAFYAAHYAPSNAVLAIVGDVDRRQARALVRRHFGPLPTRPAPSRVAAVEPLQRGERRIRLAGAVGRQHFEVAYPAPAASSPDHPAFLILQQMLSGGSGVNFRQNDWGTPAVAGAALHGAAEDLKSWFIPTADRYLLTITGSVDANADSAALERDLERRISRLRSEVPRADQMAAARAAVAGQLVFDVETTEDAAHQLAFFEGIGAFERLLDLPRQVAAVSGEDVRRVAQAYLAPELRTIGWLVPGDPPAQAGLGVGTLAPAAPRPGAPPRPEAAALPELRRLSGGLAAIVQRSPLSPTASVQVLLTAPLDGEGVSQDWAGIGTVTRSGPAAALPTLIADARRALARRPAASAASSD